MGASADISLDPSLRELTEVARCVAVDPAVGLSTVEAGRRLRRDGPNELRAKPPVPVWRKVLSQFQDPLVYLLVVAVAISVAAWLAEGAAGAPIDAIVITAIIVVNGVLGYVEQDKAETAVAALQSMTEATSLVLRDSELRTVASRALVRGDVLVLSEGDAVGADARLMTATALRVSEASLTGESESVTKNTATLAHPVPLGERSNMVFRGTTVTQGVGRAVVTATGMSTEVGAIAEMLETTTEDLSPLQKEIAGVSRMLGVTVIVIAAVVMIVTAVTNDVSTSADLVTVLLLGVSLAVAAVPEGLPAILSVVLALGVQRLARRNAIVKTLPSVETLGSATVIASDKTGTLTRNEMTIQRIRTASGEVELTGVGYRPDGRALSGGQELCDPVLSEARMVLTGGSLANNAQLTCREGEWEIQGDPTEAAFLVAAHKLDGVVDRAQQFRRCGEVPFTSDRKMMSALVTGLQPGTAVVAKGAPDVLLRRCVAVQVGAEVVPLDPDRRAAAVADVDELSAQAYRTLGVAYRRADDADTLDGFDEDDERDLVYVGVVGIIDPPRSEAAAAVAEARRAGVRVMMITGDHPVTAARIAEHLGIPAPGATAITGAEIDALSPEQLRDVTATTAVYARVAPQNKLQIVDALQARHEVVAMTGDGVNDAPALKSADIGVAMGITGTPVTKQAAKMILADDNFATIVAAVRQGRVIFDNIKKFLRYLLSSNMGEVFTVFFGVLFAGYIGITGGADETIVVPLLVTQILWINLITDSGPALAMGVDPEIDDVMARPPRRSTDRLIDPQMWRGIVSVGLVMGAATLLTMDICLPGGLVEGSDSLDVARTAGFTTLVFAQLFNAFNSRSATTSAFRHLFSNRWLWTSVALAVVLQILVVQLPFLQTAFGTTSLDLAHWALAAAMASAVLGYGELRKLVLRGLAAR
ncbi:haloacid dehalogenase [Mycolicibacterium duvalii]|uniref:Haloacid dehalogenase n=1 Tax=Mycolicibacterium duvalii TaxID=39688 RepID=A0A7I7K624_9MYCO|nr:cation-translocating P-type ATPase [Mycolicibacterium duvalii]MCV7366098.1 cation-translocating P-type ATPase [Mycolicibacterium duvalii]PEG40067.1 haloacid dehalogenase [Mycolicibacterium duvalii]BBX19546.1 haloacid dehalogenase [Mycolicibacterium duvalii]